MRFQENTWAHGQKALMRDVLEGQRLRQQSIKILREGEPAAAIRTSYILRVEQNKGMTNEWN